MTGVSIIAKVRPSGHNNKICSFLKKIVKTVQNS